ncbi:DUF1648 domain-containing protein [Streptomyces sp. NBC_01335]|uniref:DUF1648 domain-containing protein n=1 Tax=Streptomyces sp. NBC_01335 TaxID=2903828 RepID=UPI002E10F802|nr:DUF1648 domain-containing protein [Streptomyces sp. NBC_01335]
MSERAKSRGGAIWGAVCWTVGVLALLVGMVPAASGRLPERVATHWNGAGRPDGAMPLWAAALVPALIWAVAVVGIGLAVWRANARRGGAARGWAGATLVPTGVFLAGVQASIVRANLDRADWHEAGSVTVGTVGTLVVAAVVGLAAWRVSSRRVIAPVATEDGPRMDLPTGQRLMWFSRASNPWLHVSAALAGVVALATVLVAAVGVTAPQWTLIMLSALTSVLFLGCASVQATVSEKGLKVSFGPLGWPARRWTLQDIESARSEYRRPTQVGGWGYRLSGLGTTVMLRGGECLVISARGKDFAVSVDDAERGAALLNSLGGRRSG